MGETCKQLTFLTLDASNWINIAGILINGFLALWVVNTIQKRLDNKRHLKDHFIDEVKNLKDEYKSYLSNLYGGNVTPQNVLAWFKLMNIKVNDLMDHLDSLYKIDKKILNPYQNDLRELITESEDFIEQYNEKKLSLSTSARNSLIKFQQENNKIFTSIIIHINEK